MPEGLKRYQNTGDLHFITFSCFRHRHLLGTPERRDTFVNILERTRQLYTFILCGYVVMPNHVHLLISEPPVEPLSKAIQILKQRFSKTCEEEEVWEERYYDFNVKTEDKRIEKLRYVHRNPVKRGLVSEPAEWLWSSYRAYALNEPGQAQITRPWDSSPEA